MQCMYIRKKKERAKDAGGDFPESSRRKKRMFRGLREERKDNRRGKKKRRGRGGKHRNDRE